MVDQALQIEDKDPDASDDRPAEKIGNIGDGLDALLDRSLDKFVEDESKTQGEEEVEDHVPKADDQRVGHRCQEVRILDDKLIICKACERSVSQEPVLLETHDKAAEEWIVGEYNEVDGYRDEHEVEDSVFLELSSQCCIHTVPFLIRLDSLQRTLFKRTLLAGAVYHGL